MSIDRWILLTKGEGAGGLPTAGALVPGCDECQLLTEGRPPAEDAPFLPIPPLYSPATWPQDLSINLSVCVYKYSNVAAHWLVLQQIKDFGLLKLSMALSWRMLWEDWYSFEVFHYAWVMADELLRSQGFSFRLESGCVLTCKRKTILLYILASFTS